MNDLIKSNLTSAYISFVHDYGDPSSVNKKELEDKAHCKIDELFNRQRNADIAKKKLGKQFDQAVALYLNKFLREYGVDYTALARALTANEHTFTLHLKKDAVRYLKLITQIASAIAEKPKGLLAA